MDSLSDLLKDPKIMERMERLKRYAAEREACPSRVEFRPVEPGKGWSGADPACTLCLGRGLVYRVEGPLLRWPRDPLTGEERREEHYTTHEQACSCFNRERLIVREPAECGLGGKLEHMTLAGVQTERLNGDDWQRVADWAAGLPGTLVETDMAGLVLTGAVGTGKTGLMAALCHAARLVGKRPLFIREVDMKNEVTATFDGEGSETKLIDRWSKIPLLAIDDLGKAYIPPKQYGQDGLQWWTSILYAVIDERLTQGRPTLITTNLDDDALLRRLGDALLDRVDTFWRLDFTGKSRRS